jgi:hypothetical protein
MGPDRFLAVQRARRAIQAKEIQLWLSTLKAVRITVADDALDLLVDRSSSALLVVTSGSREAALCVFYFTKQPQELKRSVLAGRSEPTMAESPTSRPPIEERGAGLRLLWRRRGSGWIKMLP